MLPQVDNRQPAQPVHVLLKACTGDTLKTLGDPELVGTSSGTGMCGVCPFYLFVCKVLCFQRVCFLFAYICLQYMHNVQSDLVALWVVTLKCLCVHACQFTRVCPPLSVTSSFSSSARDMTNTPLYSHFPLCLSQVIACHYASPEETLKPYVPQICPFLYGHFESLDEGTRNVVAECVGKPTLPDPDTMLPRLKVRG